MSCSVTVPAEELAKLKAENERLREALKAFVDLRAVGKFVASGDFLVDGDAWSFAWDAARRALGEEETKP